MHITGDFDAGSLLSAQVNGDAVQLSPVPYAFNGRPTGNWFFFRIDGAAGRDLEFSFDCSACDLHGFGPENRRVTSTDGVHWLPIDRVSGSGNDYRFRLTISADSQWIAHSVPFPMARVQSAVRRWLGSSMVSPTASADSQGRVRRDDGELWTSPGGMTATGFVIPPQVMYALQVAAPGLAPDAPVAIAIGGNHAGEHLASHALEALVDWWISADPEALALRQRCRLLVYPMVNPDGRFGGFVRGGPAMPNGDHNRFWGPADSPTVPSIDCLKRAMARDVLGPVGLCVDFHNQERFEDRYLIQYHHAVPGRQRAAVAFS